MSRLNDIVSACESPEQVKNILEAMGSGWTDFIAMHAKKNIPYWGDILDPTTGEWKCGYELNPDAVEYSYDELTEEEKLEAAEDLWRNC
jgi:hypothetical protein